MRDPHLPCLSERRLRARVAEMIAIVCSHPGTPDEVREYMARVGEQIGVAAAVVQGDRHLAEIPGESVDDALSDLLDEDTDVWRSHPPG